MGGRRGEEGWREGWVIEKRKRKEFSRKIFQKEGDNEA